LNLVTKNVDNDENKGGAATSKSDDGTSSTSANGSNTGTRTHQDVSLSNEGDIIVVGGFGIACIVEWKNKDGWMLVGNPIGADYTLSDREFGVSVELAGEKKIVTIFESYSYAYVIYEHTDDSLWVQIEQVITSNWNNKGERRGY
jgi:hypothetical protein